MTVLTLRNIEKLSIPQVLVAGFALCALIGALLLALPISRTGPGGPHFVDALFTATSAVCVTGLIVVDTGSYWSHFGQFVILILMQIGGLGIMTFSTLALVLAGGRISYHFRIILKESLNRVDLHGIVGIVSAIFKITFIIEGIGFVFFFVRFLREMPLSSAAWMALFHTVSAFCNAGFCLMPDSFMQYRDSLWMNLNLAFLIIAGGLGFTVLIELKEFRETRKLSLHSKLVLIVTGALLAGGTLIIFLTETFKHPYHFSQFSFYDKLITSFFQSVTARTAGFNTIDIGAMSDAGVFFLIALMFIGASPGGTGGGIKTTTFGVMTATLFSVVRGRDGVNILGRHLDNSILLRAFVIALISIAAIMTATLVMVAIEGRHLMDILFEVTSAFSTVGLSTGITSELNTIERLLITILMFVGRVGPLTLAMAMTQKSRSSHVKYPDGVVMVG